ncbi:MAG TPA: hypothetical protein DCQ80_17690 [Pseudomonas sp.]|nr:hypothetical protein [Pseudomonas sp.]
MAITFCRVIPAKAASLACVSPRFKRRCRSCSPRRRVIRKWSMSRIRDKCCWR